MAKPSGTMELRFFCFSEIMQHTKFCRHRRKLCLNTNTQKAVLTCNFLIDKNTSAVEFNPSNRICFYPLKNRYTCTLQILTTTLIFFLSIEKKKKVTL
jgi:hypothetical protein